jgi:glycosyltransferase involved in cell wall biosynthesis
MKVLIAAYAFRPGEGSEQGAAWNLISRLARDHEIWVVTRAKHRESIELHLRENPQPSLRVIYHEVPLLLPLKRLPGGLYLYHYAWHLSLAPVARMLHKSISFDLTHHLTLGSFRYPSGLRNLGVPMIMGPVGGGEDSPMPFWTGLGVVGFLQEMGRSLSNWWALKDPLVRASYRSAACVLAVTEQTRRRLNQVTGSAPIQVLPQSGVDPQAVAGTGEPRLNPSGAVQVLFVGRLVPWKGAHLAVEAFAIARAQRSELQLTILGVGPAEKRVRRLIEDKQLSGVRMLGRLPKIEDVHDLYRRSDVFLFPSLHDSGGMAVLEAMAAGLPVICLDLGGPAVSVTRDCGFVVSSRSPRESVSEMASALIELADSPPTWSRMSHAARSRVIDYSWDTKAAEIDRIYRSLSTPS